MTYFLGLTFEPKCADIPTTLLVKACIHLLRCISVGLAINSDNLHSNTAHFLASLIHHIVSCDQQGILYL